MWCVPVVSWYSGGAKVNKRGVRGETPLFKAVVRGQADVVRLLLERGADPNKSDTQYKFGPLSMAIRKGIYAVFSTVYSVSCL